MDNSPISSAHALNHRSQIAGSNRRPGNGRNRHTMYRDVTVPIQQQILDRVYNSSLGRAVSGPSIFSRTPAEHCKEHEKLLQKLPFKYRVFLTRLRPPVPAGFVYVRLFASLDILHRRFWRASLEAVLPLEADGGFDLTSVKKLWNLETCVPVSPIYWKAVEPSTPNSLSPIAVMTLLELYDCISFIEPTVSEVTQKKRAIREKINLGVESLVSKFRFNQLWRFKILKNTSLAESFNKAKEVVQYSNLRLRWWLGGLSAPQRNILVLLLILLLCLLLFGLGFLSCDSDAPLAIRWDRYSFDTIDKF